MCHERSGQERRASFDHCQITASLVVEIEAADVLSPVERLHFFDFVRAVPRELAEYLHRLTTEVETVESVRLPEERFLVSDCAFDRTDVLQALMQHLLPEINELPAGQADEVLAAAHSALPLQVPNELKIGR